MQHIIFASLLVSIVFAFAPLYYLNKNYKTCFGSEFEWQDLWIENIRLSRKLESILGSLVIFGVWILLKDNILIHVLSVLVYLCLIIWYFISFTTGISYAEEDESWTPYWEIFRMHFAFWGWTYPKEIFEMLYVHLVVRNGRVATYLALSVYVFIFIHALLQWWL